MAWFSYFASSCRAGTRQRGSVCNEIEMQILIQIQIQIQIKIQIEIQIQIKIQIEIQIQSMACFLSGWRNRVRH